MPGCKSRLSALPVLTYWSTLRAGSRNSRFSPRPGASHGHESPTHLPQISAMPGCEPALAALPVLTYWSTLRAGSRHHQSSLRPDENL